MEEPTFNFKHVYVFMLVHVCADVHMRPDIYTLHAFVCVCLGACAHVGTYMHIA